MIKRTTIKKEGLRIMTMQKRIEAFFNKLESTSKLIQKAKEECEESLKQLEDDRLDDVDESIMDNPKLDKIMERIDYFDSIRFDKISQLDDGELINYISNIYLRMCLFITMIIIKAFCVILIHVKLFYLP